MKIVLSENQAKVTKVSCNENISVQVKGKQPKDFKNFNFFKTHIAVEYRNFEFTSLSSDCYQIEIYQI